METELFETFRQVASQGSISGAARRLGYTQSAVSRQVATLETRLGARLFDRLAGGVQLTEHGRCLLSHAVPLLERLDLARVDLAALDRLEGGRLRIGAFQTANASLIPRAMAAFAAECPKVSLVLVEGVTKHQLSRLETDDVDVAIVSTFPGQNLNRKRFDLVPVLDDAMLVALPRSHRLSERRKPLRLAEIENDAWIGGEPTDEDDRVLGPARVATMPGTDFPVREWTAKLGLVAAGLGVTLVPSLAADATRADVALIPLHQSDAPARKVYATTLKGRTPPPALGLFISALKQSARSLKAE
jgi:DNA-binding transcriptional LysR family regulator